ncbi:MAG: class I tRNA ligase family protein, partial [Alistipes sp.]|nr:class I tRNA ligase family protein [Alistipes sp.]
EWFRNRFNAVMTEVEADFAAYRISDALMKLYKLFWDDFSGRYLEIVKPAYGQPTDPATLAATKGFFEKLMLALHPFMPFVTEEIWQDLAPRAEGESIMVAQMPATEPADEKLLARFELAQEAVSAIRNLRKQKNIPQKESLTLKVIADDNYPAEYAPVIMKSGNLDEILFVTEKDAADAGFIVKTTQYFVPMGGLLDAEAEIATLTKDLAYYEGFLQSVMRKLSNERFVSSAPEKVVANERAKQADAEAKIAAIKEQLAALKH